MEPLKESDLKPDKDAPAPPRVRFGEVGYLGLRATAKRVLEEANVKLRFPYWLREVEEMRKDPSVAVAIQLYRMMIGRVKWRVEPPVGATDKQKERAKAVQSMMDDMEHSWSSFINEVTTMIEYGFCINEKVYKRRTKETSKYNDNLVGWKKLPIRSQSTVRGWKFAPDGRGVEGVYQSLFNLTNMGVLADDNPSLVSMGVSGSVIEIPRNKFLLFNCDTRNGNPEGHAPLKSSWLSYQYKKAVQEQEFSGLTRELGGIPVASIPARYMSPDASPEEKAIYDYYMAVVRNIHHNQQSGLVMPSETDPDSKQPLFKFELLKSQGSKAYDTSAIIARYDSQILISMFADLLQLGNNSMGSFALASSKSNLIAMAIEYRLKEIRDVLNFDLIPQTFRLNGWDDKDYPTFEFGDLDEVDIGEFASAIQRLSATNSIEKDRSFYNLTRTKVGLQAYPEDDPVHDEFLAAEATSRSGDSFNTPSGGLEGTRKSLSGDDKSVSNLEND